MMKRALTLSLITLCALGAVASCSQHQPGPWEGGGRANGPAAQPDTTSDADTPDTFTGPPDTGVDTGGG